MDGYAAPSAIDPAWNPRPPRRWGKWIAIGLIAALSVSAGAWWFLSQRSASRSATQAAIEQATREAAQCAPGEAGCRALRVTDAASQAGSPEACRLLDGSEYADCVWAVASASGDQSVCEGIDDEESRSRCETSVVLQAVFSTGDHTRCAQIADEKARTACEQAFVPPDCAQDAEDPTACEAQQATTAAVAANDANLCAPLEDESKRNGCFLAVENQDPDADHLLTVDELSYGTSPVNPDSDGDGFKDGDEVAAGFNPSGPGQL